MANYLYFGGIEGGASNTKFVLVRSDGKILSSCSGEGTNQYLIGIPECLRRINNLVQEALRKENLPPETVLEGLGMSLSGGDEKSAQEKFISTIKCDFPGLSKHTFVGSDTQSAVATALPQGGIVLIAGTGSNCQVVNSDGSTPRCGGWGHLIGDEASACWISLQAVKIYMDHEDNFVPSSHDISKVRDAIFKYFKLETRSDICDHLYKDFDKAKFSGLCKELATIAKESHDTLICNIFKEAGKLLARHLIAVAGKVDKEIKSQEGGLAVVCVGSVFKSWDLLEEGFINEMKRAHKQTEIHELSLLKLNVEASIGAAALGAKVAGFSLPLNYKDNAHLFFHTNFTS